MLINCLCWTHVPFYHHRLTNKDKKGIIEVVKTKTSWYIQGVFVFFVISEADMGKVHEECGVFGVYSKTPDNLALLAYYALYALQHRGQESVGIVVNDDGVFRYQKGDGLVSEVYTSDQLRALGSRSCALCDDRRKADAEYPTPAGQSSQGSDGAVPQRQSGELL